MRIDWNKNVGRCLIKFYMDWDEDLSMTSSICERKHDSRFNYCHNSIKRFIQVGFRYRSRILDSGLVQEWDETTQLIQD